MKKILILFQILLTCCPTLLFSQREGDKYHRVEVNLQGKDFAKLTELGIETDHGQLLPGRSFTTDLSETEIEWVRRAGFEHRIVIEDVSSWYAAQNQASIDFRGGNNDCFSTDPFSGIKTPSNYKFGSMGGYHTYQEMLNTLTEMHQKFPNLITKAAPIDPALKTHEGRDIYFVKISNNAALDEGEPEMLFDALHHAREPNSLSAMLFFMWHLLENYHTDPVVKYILDHSELYFIPCINPDGYIFNEVNNPNGGGLFRKNRRDNDDGTFGVDLNRNYGYQWGVDNNGSSPQTNAQTYRGPAPFSEPETQMMRNFARQHEFRIIFNSHTYSNLLIYPWAYSDAAAHPAFPKLGKLLTSENKYRYGVGSQTVGYPVNGNSDDWFYFDGASFAFTPEIGPTNFGFWPPASQIDRLNKEAFWMNLKAALCILKFGEVTDDSPEFVLEKTFDLPFSITRHGFLDGALTVELQAVSNNVKTISSSQVFDIQQFEKKSSSFSVQLSDNVKLGDVFKLELSLSNGDITWRDTLTKTFGFSNQTAFADAAQNTNNWLPSKWALSTEYFVSPPSSFHDSKNGLYQNNSQNSLFLKEPIRIPADAENPRLNFWARWSIETDYDYVQVLANEGALCGNYTNSGVNSQPKDEPVFDGFQNEWVLESMDLSAYKGLDVYLEFRLVADQFQNFDGFYFDDLTVTYSVEGSSVKVLPSNQFSLKQNQPNPANDQTTIFWEIADFLNGEANLFIFNHLGQVVYQDDFYLQQTSKFNIDTRHWPQGIYFYQIRTARGTSETRKMVISR